MGGRAARVREVAVATWIVVACLIGSAAPAAADEAEGTAGGSIAGTVSAPAGTDLTKVTVYVDDSDGDGRASGWAGVAADGTYVVSGLAPGSYRVEFMGWGAGLLLEYWGDTPYLGQAAWVTVGTGLVGGIDARLEKGATVSGTISTASGCDLERVKVYAWGADGQTLPDAWVQPDGRWTIVSLPTSTYRIEFDGRYAGMSRHFWGSTRDPLDGAPLALTAGEVRTGIDAVLHATSTDCFEPQPFVRQVYRDLLRREADPLGLNSWVNALTWGAPPAAVANGITSSDEFRMRMITEAYQHHLMRGTDPAGLAFWLDLMRRGRHIEQVEAGFVASDEFYLRAGGTPSGWVTALYTRVIGRQPSPEEVRWWEGALAHGASREQVALGFLYSTEHLIGVVDGYYVSLLERHVDPVGQQTWVGMIQAGHRDEEIIAGIVASLEYRLAVPD